jgi:S-DNA-T family DNA segregation ATPase FtsK/SpoIIIE
VNFIKSQDTSEFSTEQKISFEATDDGNEEGSDLELENRASTLGGEGSDRELYAKAVAIVKRDRKPSISYVQRQLRIGYNRAAILIERMEKEGVITPPSVSGKREVLD